MFTDAVKMQELHPTTFELPEKQAMDALSVGDFCKICAGGERFWVRIKKIKENNLVGIVDNDLFATDEHGLKFKDKVSFKTENIYDILPK